MSEEEDALLYHLHVGLEHKLLSQRTIDIFQKLNFLVVLQRNFLHLRLFLPNITLHLVAEFTTELIMFLQLMDSRLVLLKLQILLLNLIYCKTYHVDHVSEDCCADNLNESYDYCLYEVVGSQVAISYGHHRRIGPVVGVNVQDVPRFFGERGFVDPSLTPLWAKFGHYV